MIKYQGMFAYIKEDRECDEGKRWEEEFLSECIGLDTTKPAASDGLQDGRPSLVSMMEIPTKRPPMMGSTSLGRKRKRKTVQKKARRVSTLSAEDCTATEKV